MSFRTQITNSIFEKLNKTQSKFDENSNMSLKMRGLVQALETTAEKGV